MHWVLLPFPIWCHLCSLLSGVFYPVSVTVSDPVSNPVSVAVSDPVLFVVFGHALGSATISHLVSPLFSIDWCF